MAAVANLLNVADRNAQIRNPLNPTGEVRSALDPNSHVSYGRWSLSVVYYGTVEEAFGIPNLIHHVQRSIARVGDVSNIQQNPIDNSQRSMFAVGDVSHLQGNPLTHSLQAIEQSSDKATSVVMKLFSHARLVIERVTPGVGYELIDIDLRQDELLAKRSHPGYCEIRRFINTPESLIKITMGIGPLFKKAHKIH